MRAKGPHRGHCAKSRLGRLPTEFFVLTFSLVSREARITRIVTDMSCIPAVPGQQAPGKAGVGEAIPWKFCTPTVPGSHNGRDCSRTRDVGRVRGILLRPPAAVPRLKKCP